MTHSQANVPADQESKAESAIFVEVATGTSLIVRDVNATVKQTSVIK